MANGNYGLLVFKPEQQQQLETVGESQWPHQPTNGVKLEVVQPHSHDEQEHETMPMMMMGGSSGSHKMGAVVKKEEENLMCDDGNMYYGRLTYRDHSLLIHKLCITIGRNSSKSVVDFHVSKNNFISRKHMLVRFHPDTDSFHLECLSKNGIFVDGMFQRSNMEPMELPKK